MKRKETIPLFQLNKISIPTLLFHSIQIIVYYNLYMDKIVKRTFVWSSLKFIDAVNMKLFRVCIS